MSETTQLDNDFAEALPHDELVRLNAVAHLNNIDLREQVRLLRETNKTEAIKRYEAERRANRAVAKTWQEAIDALWSIASSDLDHLRAAIDRDFCERRNQAEAAGDLP